MQFTNNNYFQEIDYFGRDEGLINTQEPAPIDPETGQRLISDEELNFTHKEIGTGTNPMGNTLQSLKSRILEGNRRIEFEFIGKGKGNSQSPTPESFGTLDRRDIRELVKINEMKTATHASVHADSLAGFTQEGFNTQARETALKEIKKAIDFAGEATKGGAVVFHFTEWQRPMSDLQDQKQPDAKFKGFSTEEKESARYVVDAETGNVIGGIRKDQKIFRPKYKTAKDYGLVGKKDDDGHVFQEGDWVDIDRNFIPKDAKIERLMDRVPEFNKDKTKFEVQELGWEDIVKETNEYNKQHPTGKHLTPEELYAKTQLETNVLQAKGSSLFYARQYESDENQYIQLKKNWENYKEAVKRAPDKKREHQRFWLGQSDDDRMPGNGSIEDKYEMQLRMAKNSLRYVHEASSAADVQAATAAKKIDNVRTVEEYGKQKTAETVASAALEAMRVYNKNKVKYELEDPIYVAPENWDPHFYGSHPDEYIELIKTSRNKMVEQLTHEGHSKKEAQKLAQTHIRGTLDIGHLNLFRTYFQAKPGESPEQRDQRFEDWMIKQSERLVKGGYVSHIHLTDNFGYDDEHLTPGQGNVPLKRFMKKMQEAGINDFTVESGSYNIGKEVPEVLETLGSPIYGVHRAQRWNQTKGAHFGYNAPGFFVAGTYSPSNEWRPWSDVPLE